MSIFTKSRVYRFKPQSDITAYELAQILEKILGDRLSSVTVADEKAENFAPFRPPFRAEGLAP